MYFNASLSVYIKGINMTNIVSVKTDNDAQKIGQICDIVLPLNAYIQYNDQNNKTVYLNAILTNFFKSGDQVQVYAQYEGMNPVNVFNGFIYDFIEGMPLKIKCMDYFYWFNLGIFGNHRVFAKKGKKSKITSSGTGNQYASIGIQSLLNTLISFVNQTISDWNKTNNTNVEQVSLIMPVPQFTLSNVTFLNLSPAGVLEWLKKSVGFNISMIGSQLYFNLASNTLNTVNLDTGVNVIKSSLQKPLATFQRIRLKCWFIRTDGTRDSFDIGDESGDMKEVFFYNIKRDGQIYENLANNALLKYSQHKFSGEVETYLYPDCQLFDVVEYVDRRYPDKNGRYTIIKDEIYLSDKGFRRKHKLSFLVDIEQL